MASFGLSALRLPLDQVSKLNFGKDPVAVRCHRKAHVDIGDRHAQTAVIEFMRSSRVDTMCFSDVLYFVFI